MSTPTQKTPGNREKIVPSVTTGSQIVPVTADEDHYPGGHIGMMLWVSAVVLLAGFLLWDLVTALLFR
jgi:hypothetical protein